MSKNTACTILAVAFIAACVCMVITNHIDVALAAGFGAWVCLMNIGDSDA